MTRATVWVEANEGGEPLVETVRSRLTTDPHLRMHGSALPVEVRAFYGRTPVARREAGGYDAYHHAEDGSTCIWVDDHWFVPTSAGGDGYACALEHAHVTDCLHDPKTYFFGAHPDQRFGPDPNGLDPDGMVYFEVGSFVERIYVAPWVDMRPPVHAAWLHQPTGATSPVCDRDAVGETVYDHIESVTCVVCLRLLVQMRRLER